MYVCYDHHSFHYSMDTDIPSPREDMEECTDRNNSHSSQHASLCVPEQGRNQTFAEYGGDGVTRGLVVDVVPRAPQIVTFCAEKGPPISRPILQDREQASTDDSTSVEETLSYKDEAQHKVS